MEDPRRPATAAFELDGELTEAFVAGGPDSEGEAVLAGQVARIIPRHAELPNPIVARLSSIVDHLGGDGAVIEWLENFPGRPRLVARLMVLVALLDRFSGESAVVTALAEFRENTPVPPALQGCLPPHTDDDTLASIGWQIEQLAGEDRTDDAIALATATVDMVEEIAPRASQLDPDVADLGEQLEMARQDVLRAASQD